MKTDRSNAWLKVIAFVGMELSWRYAWLNLLAMLLLPAAFPWPYAVAAFAGSGLLTALLAGRGLRTVTVLLAHLIFFALLARCLVCHFHGGDAGLFDWSWLVRLAGSPRPLAVWSALIFELALAAWLWIGGCNLARRPKNHKRLGIRFDIGLTALFILVLFEAMLTSSNFAMVIDDRAAQPMIISFFCFGLLGLALARVEGAVQREASPGYRGLGMVVTLLVFVLALAGGTMAFFMPYLAAAAETGFEAVKFVVRPLAPYLVALLKFLFVGRGREEPAKQEWLGPGPEAAPGGAAEESSSWLVAAGQVFAWAVIVLIALAMLIFLAYLLYLLCQRLGRRTSAPVRRVRLLDQIWEWLYAWADRLARAAALVRSRRTGPLEVYAGLMKWGGRSGLPRIPGETPREYGGRLASALPRAAKEIEVIVDYLETAVFALRPLGKSDLKILSRSWRHLARPGLWRHRLRIWLPGARRGE